MPPVLRASWPSARAAVHESLKNPRLRVKRKTGRRIGRGRSEGSGYLSRRGNHVSHVDPRLWTGQKFYKVIFSERKGYVHSYPSHVGSHGVILRPVLNAPRRDDPGVARAEQNPIRIRMRVYVYTVPRRLWLFSSASHQIIRQNSRPGR